MEKKEKKIKAGNNKIIKYPDLMTMAEKNKLCYFEILKKINE